MPTQTFSVRGMHCASCAATITKALQKVDGVASAVVNYGTETARIDFDAGKTDSVAFARAIEPLGYTLRTPDANEAESAVPSRLKQEKLAELAAMRRSVLSALPLAVVSVLMMVLDIGVAWKKIPELPLVWKEFFHHLLPIMATYVLFVIGKPYLLGVVRFLRSGKANMDTLIGIGTSVAFLYSFFVTALEASLRPWINVDYTYYDVTIVVITFIALGKYLEARSKLKTGDAIEKLLNLQAKTALVVRAGKEQEIPIADVIIGDRVIVKPGARIPVDGVIADGESFIDEAMVTGEPMPVAKKVGDAVVAGTMNTSGAFTFTATKVGADTMLARIIAMVEEAQGSTAPIQALADRISAIFVPVVLVLAFLALVVWLVIGTPYLGFSQALSLGLVSFVSILVIACPCALGLATPTTIIVGVGKGAREGILIKDAATLEKLHAVDVVVVDKTGTITKGKPELVSIKNISDKTDDDLLAVLAALEQKSEHPIAYAIVSAAREKQITSTGVEAFAAIKGKGVEGTIDGVRYRAGNAKLMTDMGLSFDAEGIERETRDGKTPVFLATKEKILGIFMVADAVKPEAASAVARLRALGIRVVMVTGDDANTAHAIAEQVGIDDVVAEVLPEDKMKKIKQLQAERHIVAMAGDGVNDAPALAQADVGIAMATGTDVAIASAGITLLHGDIAKVVKAIALSRMTMRGIKQNLFWAFAYNLIGIPLAAGVFYPFFGWLLSPVFAGLAMALSSVSVVGNSLRIKAKKL